MRSITKTLLISAFIVFSFAFFFGFSILTCQAEPSLYPYDTSEYEYNVISEYGSSHQQSTSTLGQTFQVTSNRIADGFMIGWLGTADPGTTYPDFTFYLCESDSELADEDFLTEYDCTNNTLLDFANVYRQDYISTTSVHYEKIELNGSITLQAGNWYYFTIEPHNEASTTFAVSGAWSADLITGDILKPYNEDNYDLQFRIYQLFDGSDTQVGAYELSETEADFNTAWSNVCFINETCNIWYWYNDLALGGTIYITPPYPNYWPEDAMDSEVITWHAGNESVLNPTIETSVGTTSFCLWFEGYSGETTRKCGYDIAWVASTTWQPDFSVFDDPCWDIATSADSWFDWEYGLNCGLRKLSHWAFIPSNETYTDFERSVENFKYNFPISSILLVKYTLEEIQESTSTPLSIPLVLWQGLGESEPSLLVSGEISEDVITQNIDSDLFDNYYTYTTTFIYLMGGLYIILRIFSLTRAKE